MCKETQAVFQNGAKMVQYQKAEILSQKPRSHETKGTNKISEANCKKNLITHEQQ